MGEYVLRTEHLTKTYKKQNAVDDVSLHVRKGEIYGFIGRNGAGKTTFMRLICGLATPTGGEIELFGEKGGGMRRLYSRIGTLIESPGLYPSLTGGDNLKLKCICVGLKEPQYIPRLLELVGLKDAGGKKIKEYSMGMKQRLGIAMALVGEPDFLVLDEPINGLDPQGIVEVRDTLLRLNQEKNITIMISSHILEELSKLATTFGIIHRGKLIKELTKDKLLEQCGQRIEIKLEQPELARPVLEEMGFHDYTVIDGQTVHVLERLDESGDITMALSKAGVRIQSIAVGGDSLESFFLTLTGGEENV